MLSMNGPNWPDGTNTHAIASGEEKYMETVREGQKSIDVPNGVYVDSRWLELGPDNLT